MGPGPTRNTVLQLRSAREDLGLSISEIMELLKQNHESTGAAYPSESSVRSVLNGDLDKISGFSHDATLGPLKAVLLKEKEQYRIDELLGIIKTQEAEIAALTRRLAIAEETYQAERKAAAEAQQMRCSKCERDTAFLKEQIAIKDRRMERKDKWIAELLKLPIQDEEEAE